MTGSVPVARLSSLPVAPLSESGAAELSGLDLARPLAAETVAALRRALNNYPVLVFRNQALSKDRQADFSRNFGELEGHIGKLSDGSTFPLVHTLVNRDDHGRLINMDVAKLNRFWHTDKSYHAEPAFVTILHALEVPQSGGETQFANTALAYDAVSEAMKAEIDELTAVHDWVASRINSGTSPATEEQKRERPPVIHPLVRTHPDTGRGALYLGVHVSHIVGMAKAESDALLADLTAHIEQARFCYTHRWQKGDVVMWDNRCLLHRALDNYDIAGQPRVLNRTVVAGTRPY